MPDQIFRGRGAKGFNWEHIIERHAPEGSVAQQRLRDNPDYIVAIFENMTENQIKGCVQRAWKNRERVDTQEDLITEVIRINGRVPKASASVCSSRDCDSSFPLPLA